MKTVLITGAYGSIGTQLCESLKKKYNLLYIIRQPNNKKDYYTFNTIKNYNKNIDILIHLAGFNPKPFLKLKNEKLMYKKNIAIHKKVIKIIHKNKVKKVIFFSSFSLYDQNKLITENSNIKINNLYSKSKLWMERKLLKENISAYILRSSAIIFNGTSNNWISQVISKISFNEKIELFNKNNFYNNCLSFNDLKKVIFKLINRKKINEKKIYNISSNSPITISKLKKIISKNRYYTNNVLIKKKLSIKDFFNDSSKIQKDLDLKFESTYKTLSSILSADLRRKLIIFGSSGYLGKFLKRKFEKNFKIISVNRKNFKFLINKKNDKMFYSSMILYLALINSKKNFLKENINNLNKIIEKIPTDKIYKFLLISSAHSHNTEYLKFNKIREKKIKEKFKNKVFTLCPGKIYGNQILDSNYGINSFLSDIKKKEINIYGNGKNYCPHTYINDLANIISYFIKKNLKAKKYYIYDKKKINFLDIAKKIKSYSKNRNKINLNFLGKSLKYKIKNPTLNNKLFTYTNMFKNLNKIIYEKKL
jgi:nucleoside-diphosphate-sugar epimerase